MRLNHKIFRAVLFCAGIFFSAYSVIQAQGNFVRGDANCDGFVDASDVTYIIDYLFNLGPAPPCLDAADVNDNGVVNTADIAYLASFLGAGGPPPLPPFPNCGPDPTADALTCTADCCPRNHYKTWRIEPQFFPMTVSVYDQFMFDNLFLDTIEFLSNPVKKNSFEIADSIEHLTWYQAHGRDTLLEVEYQNQFESTTVLIDSVKYLLLPTAKFSPLPFPESLDHYKAYRIVNPVAFDSMPVLDDQFDRMYGTPELIDSLKPLYFLTPALKNMSPPMYDSITHYVAYEIFPKRFFSIGVPTFDQFGAHNLQVDTSKFLLVPTEKLSVSKPPECSDGLDNDGDGLVDFPADCGCTDAADNSEAPNPATECNDGIDNDGDGLVDYPADCGCTDVCDNSEAPNPATQCNDGVDNDGDGLVDLADCGCSDVCDNTEAPNPTTQCNDGIDNDGDGFIDLADLGCSNVCDTSEFPPCDAIPGDANASGTITLADVISIVNYIFNKPGCTPQPLCWLSGKLCRGDTNGDCMVTLADVIRLVNFIFAKPCSGPGTPPCCWKPIPCPGSTCCLPNPICP